MFDTSWIDVALQALRTRADLAAVALVLTEILATAFWVGVGVVIWQLCRHPEPVRRPYGC
jgi:hypothetical protein